MKNIFKILSLACLSFAFTACVDDVEIPDRGPQGNPEKDIAGVYDGTWTVQYTEGTTVSDYQGTGSISVTASENAFAASLNAKAVFADKPSFDLDKTSAVNVSPLTNANSFQVYNAVTPNGFTKKVDSLDDKQKPIVLDVPTQLMGQVFPLDAQGELTKGDPASLRIEFDFTYEYQVTIIQNRRPRKIDCKEVYHFVGYLNK